MDVNTWNFPSSWKFDYATAGVLAKPEAEKLLNFVLLLRVKISLFYRQPAKTYSFHQVKEHET